MATTKRVFSFDVIFKLCEVLEISPKELFDFRD